MYLVDDPPVPPLGRQLVERGDLGHGEPPLLHQTQLDLEATEVAAEGEVGADGAADLATELGQGSLLRCGRYVTYKLIKTKLSTCGIHTCFASSALCSNRWAYLRTAARLTGCFLPPSPSPPVRSSSKSALCL